MFWSGVVSTLTRDHENHAMKQKKWKNTRSDFIDGAASKSLGGCSHLESRGDGCSSWIA